MGSLPRMRRLPRIATAGRAWLQGKLSTGRPPHLTHNGKKRHQPNGHSCEAEVARLQALCIFSSFIPVHEFRFLHRWNSKQTRAEYDRWLGEHLRPLLETYNLPWLCLPPEQRLRLCSIIEDSRNANVVRVSTWGEAIHRFKKERIGRDCRWSFPTTSHSATRRPSCFASSGATKKANSGSHRKNPR